MKVKNLKEMLEEWLEILEDFDGEVECSTRCNTYSVNSPFLATDEGFIDLSTLAEDLEENAMRAGLDDEDGEE